MSWASCRFSKTGAELLFEVFSQRYEQASTLVTTNLPFDEWAEVFGLERLTDALLDRLTHHARILEMNRESYRLKQSKKRHRNKRNKRNETQKNPKMEQKKPIRGPSGPLILIPAGT